jgi:small-conductance mechanosensitive channel
MMIIGGIWIKGFSNFVTYLSFLSAGFAIALKDPILGMTAWLFILWKRPFEVGDRIQIGDFKGDVIDQRLFMFTLMEVGNWVDAEQSTGRVVHVPNGLLFQQPLVNYNKGFEHIWNEIPVLITFESDWKKAKRILSKIAEKHGGGMSEKAEQKLRRAAKRYMIFYNKLTPIVYTSVKESGVMLTIRYLCEPHKRRHTEELIWEDVLTAFGKEKDIDLAYPTQRFFTRAGRDTTDS